MGRLSYKMPEHFLLKVSALADKTDVIIPKVLEEGGKVVADKVKANLQAVMGSNLKSKPRSTGELIKALGVSPAGLDRNGNYNVKVGFDEPRTGDDIIFFLHKAFFVLAGGSLDNIY